MKRRLRDGGLFGRRPVKKPLISEKNRKKRLQWAKEHLYWTLKQWEKVLWSDESKYLLFGSDGITFVRRPVGARNDIKYQLPTVKHGGGSVMVWGCFSLASVGPLVRIEGIMKKEEYKEILEKHMITFARRKLGRNWIFQQDNDPKHSSQYLKDWFQSRRVDVMDWPSQSPDLNPIEHLWEHLSRQVREKKAKNCNEKFAFLKKAWEAIPTSVLENLIASMPRRCQAVIDAKGWPTKY